MIDSTICQHFANINPNKSDFTRPLRNKRHEAFAHLLVQGISQGVAYKNIYPKSQKWEPFSVNARASKLAAVIAPRIEWLCDQAASKAVLTRQQRLEMLSTAARDASQGLKPFLKEVTPDGDLSFDVTTENLTGAIESLEQHIRPAAEGAGRDDAVVRKIKMRDFLPYIQELNRMDGNYAGEKYFAKKEESEDLSKMPLADMLKLIKDFTGEHDEQGGHY